MRGGDQCQISGHLGELIQGRLGPDGPVALITLPAPQLHICVRRCDGGFGLHQPDGVAITRPVLRQLFAALGTKLQGRWLLRAKMPIGAGAGASTAAILAIARLLRPEMSHAALEKVCLDLEGASDPLLAKDPSRLLWASRQGRVIAHLPALPKMRVVGGFLPGVRRTDPENHDFADVSDLIDAWPEACHDLHRLGDLVTRSSVRAFARRGVAFAPLAALAGRYGAAGVSLAHTGQGIGFLLPDHSDPQGLQAHIKALGWRYVQNYNLGEGR